MAFDALCDAVTAGSDDLLRGRAASFCCRFVGRRLLSNRLRSMFGLSCWLEKYLTSIVRVLC